MTDAAEPAEESIEVSNGLRALFAQASQLYDQFTADNDRLDRAWRAGNSAEVIAELRQRAQAAVDRMKAQTKELSKEPSNGRPDAGTT